MESVNYSAKGIVFDIQRYSIHDGPGIRTIVFLKGCPLRCKWCSNPESQRYEPELMFRRNLCIHCGDCIRVCKMDALDFDNPNFVDREKCNGCGDCVVVCPASALVMKGKEMTVEEVIKEIKKDATQYYRSGGGITLSGGEALTQPTFVKEIFKACKAQGWHTAIETEGYISEEAIKEVVPYIDLVLLDIKSYDSDAHFNFTKVRNEKILSNAKLISAISKTIVRVPVVPNFNDSEKEISNIADFVKSLANVEEIHLLPYHNYGENKYNLLGRKYEMEDTRTPSKEFMDGLKSLVESKGLKCKIGG